MQARHHVLDPNVPFLADNVCALAVMTKAPRAGQVKTRLVPPLSPQEAAELNMCFLRDTAASIGKALSPTVRGVAVYTPLGAESAYNDILPGQFELLPQRGDGFGERLTLAGEDVFTCGFSSVCLIDSDSPTGSGEIYAKGAELLSQADDFVVLGRSGDCGYYLFGLEQNRRQLVHQIYWGTVYFVGQTK